jgi:deleted-in-malignant-brain-tumors protein 1
MSCKSLLLAVVSQLLLSTGVRSQCTSGDVCLVGGSGLHEGRVEVCVNGLWGTVCDDSWSSNDAIVVCRQLGYTTSGAAALSQASFGAGSGYIFMDEVICSGRESQLATCPHTSNHDCSHQEDASVRCSSTRQPHTTGVCSRTIACPAYRTVRRTISTLTYTACGFLWLSRCSRRTYRIITVVESYTVDRTVPVCCSGYYADGTSCVPWCNEGCVNGRCTAPNTCTCYPGWAGLLCDAEQCPGREGSVRLAGGTLSGRVELCVGGAWGTVCDDLWDDFDASVACYQLGFSRDSKLLHCCFKTEIIVSIRHVHKHELVSI